MSLRKKGRDLVCERKEWLSRHAYTLLVVAGSQAYGFCGYTVMVAGVYGSPFSFVQIFSVKSEKWPSESKGCGGTLWV